MVRGLSLGFLLALGATVSVVSSSNDVSTDPADYDASDIIERDVVVIGGGSSGTYAAVRLWDHHKSVAVIERKGTLGGHAETYVVPETGDTIDIGVGYFPHTQTVEDYFGRFDIPLMNLSDEGSSTTYADFSTGQVVNYTAPSNEAFGAALTKYEEQLNKYPALAESFNLTYPVASDSDLLLPFGDFIAKYDLGDLVPLVFVENQGYAPLLEIPTLYMFKYLSRTEIIQLRDGTQTTAAHDIQSLYRAAAAFLGAENVLLNASVQAMDRGADDGVRVAVDTPAGTKLVVAKRLVSAVPPLVSNLDGFDLSDGETSLFSQFHANAYYTGLLAGTGLNVSLRAAAPGLPYGIPDLTDGGLYVLQQAGDGLFHTYYAAATYQAEDEVKADIEAAVRRVQEGMGIPTDGELEWKIFSQHVPFNLMVSNDAIQAGFYDNLFDLQGERNTFYTGAAWVTQSSSAIWDYTDHYLIPILLASF
ncbi:FAD/NAD(P)-binding domain-containing protein [Xylariomycetidae sp. FL0641]|nr:FAD/NAD(P)-binding domain-containing protein [Xylariomycetidae sp. FL0641]